MDGANTLPILGKKCRSIGLDLDHVAGFVDVGAAPLSRRPELI
jgi:hypothetical protein